MKNYQYKILMIGLVLLVGSIAFAASQRTAQPPQPARFSQALAGLEFREIGPAIMGGRVDEFAVVESDPKIVYVGLASGGLWKTVNAGTTWEPLFDQEAVSSIGSVAITPSDPAIVWVGTGEANNRQSSSWGNGVYKSMDSGRTWTNMGLPESHHIGRLAIHPTNPDVVYVAAGGRLWGPNHERGVFKTTDGGVSWAKVLFIDEDTGATDIAMDRSSPDTLYAAAYQRRRSAYGYNGGGPGSGIYKTINGGATWTKLMCGLPYEGETDSQTGRIGLSIFRRNPDIVYAIVEHAQGGVFRSEDRGETWTKMSDVNPRPVYYSQICVDPNNDLRIWVLGSPIYYSEDGGKTFDWEEFRSSANRIHVDNHAIWINPADSDHMLMGTDGGIHWSWDAGKTWDFVNTIAIGQFYEVGFDMKKPYRVSGGLQDNGSWIGPSMSLTKWGYWMPAGSSNNDWISIHGSDGYYTVIDPTDPNIVYAETPDGNPIRRDLRTTEARTIRPREKPGDPRYRFYWNTPIIISAFDAKTIYYAAQFLFRSTDRGDTWSRISQDLTTGVEQNSLPTMGRLPDEKMMSRQDGVWNYACITIIAESPLEADVLWVGTDDGCLQVTHDLGKTWDNATGRIPGLPQRTCVTRIVASPHAAGTAYVSFDAHRRDDFAPYIYSTTDYGRTWQSINRGIPRDNGVVHALCEHHRTPGLLFAGTETGVFVTFNHGANWEALRLNLPTVPVHDIDIHPRDNDLILGTHGRSIWILDDITPLEGISSGVLAEDLHLFDIRTATAWRIYDIRRDHAGPGHRFFNGENPPFGVIFNYFLKTKPAENEAVTIAVQDKLGKTIRRLEGSRNPGINRMAWDLRYGPAAGKIRGGRSQGLGPRVEPGNFTFKVTIGDKVVSKPVVVEEDPRLKVSPADRQVRWEAVMRCYKLSGEVSSVSQTIRKLHSALSTALQEWNRPDAPEIPGELKQMAQDLLKKVSDLNEHYASGPRLWMGSSSPQLDWRPPTIPRRLSRLARSIEEYTAVPTLSQKVELESVSSFFQETRAAIEKLIEEDLPELNRRLNQAGVLFIRISGKWLTLVRGAYKLVDDRFLENLQTDFLG